MDGWKTNYLRSFPFENASLFKGSLSYQPKQGTIKGKSIKPIIHLHCWNSPPKWAIYFMIPVHSKGTWPSFSQGVGRTPNLPRNSSQRHQLQRFDHCMWDSWRFLVTVFFLVWRLGTKKFGVFFWEKHISILNSFHLKKMAGAHFFFSKGWSWSFFPPVLESKIDWPSQTSTGFDPFWDSELTHDRIF